MKNMNEQRITDHAEHCDFYVGNEHYDKSYEEQQRLWTLKFAELIIQECIDSIEQYNNTSITKQIADEGVYSYEQGCVAGMNGSVLIIKEHFGVEE